MLHGRRRQRRHQWPQLPPPAAGSRLDRDERLVDRVDRTLHAGGQHFGVEPVDCALNPTDQIIPPAAVLSAAVLSPVAPIPTAVPRCKE